MSSRKRKAIERDKKLRIAVVCCLAAISLAIIYFATAAVKESGITIHTYTYGIVLIAIFFVSGTILSPIIKKKEKK